MATKIQYQVVLSIEGVGSVSLSGADGQVIRQTAVAAEQLLYEMAGRRSVETKPAEKPVEIPVCAVHKVPMVKQEGKFGPFWSCHKRNPHGTFCSYRPNGEEK